MHGYSYLFIDNSKIISTIMYNIDYLTRLRERNHVEESIRVKMNVQTMYKGELLRANKSYEVSKETAERWIVSGLAQRVDDK